MALFRRVVFTLASVTLLGAAFLQTAHTWNLRSYRGVEPVCRVQTSERVIALSFDDGPDPAYTPVVLNLVSAEHDHATFFVTGEHAAEYRQLIEEIVGSGNELGNHTWSHPHLTSLNEDQAMWEIDRTAASIAPFATVNLIRAPFGEIRADTLSDIRQEGRIAVHWSIALDRYVGGLDLTAQDAAAAIAADVSAGDIILAHDAHDGDINRDDAVAALRLLLPLLRARGYDVVSVGTLLTKGSPVLAAPRPWFWQSGFTCPTPLNHEPPGE